MSRLGHRLLVIEREPNALEVQGGSPDIPFKHHPHQGIITHLSWAKKVMFKTAKKGNIGTVQGARCVNRAQSVGPLPGICHVLRCLPAVYAESAGSAGCGCSRFFFSQGAAATAASRRPAAPQAWSRAGDEVLQLRMARKAQGVPAPSNYTHKKGTHPPTSEATHFKKDIQGPGSLFWVANGNQRNPIGAPTGSGPASRDASVQQPHDHGMTP